MYYYSLYGFTLESKIKIDLLKESESSPEKNSIQLQAVDFIGEYTSVEKVILHKSKRGLNWAYGASYELLLVYENVAAFHILGGEKIRVQVYEGADQFLVWSYFLGPVIGALLQQRGFLVLHGNAVVDRNGDAVIFLANSGTGKSTLTGACLSKGYSVLSDDVSAIFFDEHDKPWVVPAYGQIKLKNDAIEHFGFEDQKLSPISNMKDKYHIAVPGASQLNAMPVRQLIELVKDVEPDGRVNAFSRVLSHSYRGYHHDLMKTITIHENLALKLVTGGFAEITAQKYLHQDLGCNALIESCL